MMKRYRQAWTDYDRWDKGHRLGNGRKLLQRAAEAGNPLAIQNLAGCHEKRLCGFPRSLRLARHWFRQLENSARNGNPLAARLLGEGYHGYFSGANAHLELRNCPRARRWLELAIRHGDCRAQALLASYAPDEGPGAADLFRAFRVQYQNEKLYHALLERSAAAGNLEATVFLAANYSSGEYGAPLNPERSHHWHARLLAAAEGGDRTAQRLLGEAYAYSWGLPEDPVKARHWLAKAAENGDAVAAYSFWERYAATAGETPLVADRAEAERWLDRAIELGHPEAVYHESEHYYRRGRPTPEGVAMIEYAARSDIPAGAWETLDWLRRRRHIDRKPPRRPARAAR